MIVRPRIIAFLSSLAFVALANHISDSLALVALANPISDFIASFSNIDVPSTGTVNIPASSKWRLTGLPPFPFDKFQFVFVQDDPVITSSIIEMNYRRGQTEGTITFTPTRAGIYHLEVSGFSESSKLGEDIIITEASTTQAETHTSTNTLLSTSPPAGPTSTTGSESTPVATYPSTTTVASNSPGIPTANSHDATPRSRLGVILGTTLGLLFVLSAIALYIWYRKVLNHMWAGAFKRAERIESISPYTYSSEKNGSRKEHLNLVSNAPHVPESHGATTGQNEGGDEEALREESTIDEVVVYHDDSEWRTRQRAGRVRVLEMPPRYDSVWQES
ncbi:hypothetical protein VNI00_014180 [Paramarasmius palmivorus]|uniref:Uncharacterized protein n=1 Tax=Paramarasmius palmivorus TaxID=297713 RepID=A0AAW0BWE3_9AGAR